MNRDSLRKFILLFFFIGFVLQVGIVVFHFDIVKLGLFNDFSFFSKFAYFPNAKNAKDINNVLWFNLCYTIIYFLTFYIFIIIVTHKYISIKIFKNQDNVSKYIGFGMIIVGIILTLPLYTAPIFGKTNGGYKIYMIDYIDGVFGEQIIISFIGNMFFLGFGFVFILTAFLWPNQVIRSRGNS